MLGEKPVEIELTDKNTMEVVDKLEVDACLVATGRAPYTKVCRANDFVTENLRCHVELRNCNLVICQSCPEVGILLVGS